MLTLQLMDKKIQKIHPLNKSGPTGQKIFEIKDL